MWEGCPGIEGVGGRFVVCARSPSSGVILGLRKPTHTPYPKGVGSGRGSWGLIPARLPRSLGLILGKGILVSLPESHVGAGLSPVHSHMSRWDLCLLLPDGRSHTLCDTELPKSFGIFWMIGASLVFNEGTVGGLLDGGWSPERPGHDGKPGIFSPKWKEGRAGRYQVHNWPCPRSFLTSQLTPAQVQAFM